MNIYKIEVVSREAFQGLDVVLRRAEDLLNIRAADGWELDKLMPLESNGFSTGAILVFRKPAKA